MVRAAELEQLQILDRLFTPIVLDARERLRRQTDAKRYDLLTADAHAGWEDYLLRRLRFVGKKVVDQRFQVFCSARSAFSWPRGEQPAPESAVRLEFVGGQPAQRLREILGEFPGLARICATLATNWIATVCEFLERLSRDLAEFSRHFGDETFDHPVHELEAGLSDPHRGGRCVVRIGFRSSTSLIYKPRSVAPEVHFARLLQRLNAEGIPHTFKGVRCWDREEYGWMEEVVPRSCSDQADLHAFYWRAGALLALVYLLRGVDIHRENLIADGDQPMLIDLETLWHPQEHIGVEDHPVAHTVLRTGFLPLSNPHSGVNYEQGAFGHRSAHSWKATGHLPTLAEKTYPATEFLPDILAGFRWIGAQFFEERQPGGNFQPWLQSLVRCRRRRILRSTSWYRSVIERMLLPTSLRHVVSQSTGHLDGSQDDAPMTEDERWSLLQMDVPYFEQTDGYEWGREVKLPVQNIEAFLKQETIVINAFAPAANEGGLRQTTAGVYHHGGISVQST